MPESYGPPPAVVERRECARCHAEVREGKTRHFCGDPYPLNACDEIVVTRYFYLGDVVEMLRAQADRRETLGDRMDCTGLARAVELVEEWASAR